MLLGKVEFADFRWNLIRSTTGKPSWKVVHDFTASREKWWTSGWRICGNL